ncbi:E3 ubiquitin-protein ligase RGLG4 isoform X4 [Elaeis guineensis]|uniref:E3 ubiquitin-protein ligase RGLG4 isoform X4 n=1 Tax=Elaeis guineensis var. tenera TaxID=51953 RepID=UPI003C6CD805
MGNVIAALRRRRAQQREVERQPTTRILATQPSIRHRNDNRRRRLLTKKYSYIPDYYTSLEQVTAALRESGLESSNLILGIDFTKSNEWTATTHDQDVFSFHHDHSPCHGFEEVLACYRKIVPHLRLSVEAAVDIVEKSNGQYHVLVIIADGQVTRSVDTDIGDLSPQEKKTIDSIVMASAHPLSIVLVGVGDGPWEDMKKFDDKIPSRDFDNFQFVNFTAIMTKNMNPAEKEAAFALAALMEIPIQYKAAMELGILGHVTGTAKRVVQRPPPLSITPQRSSRREPNPSPSAISEQNQACPICLTDAKDLAFGCGHMCCKECAQNLTRCPICRAVIRSRLRLYSG